MEQGEDQDEMKTNPAPIVCQRAADYRMGVVSVMSGGKTTSTGFVVQEATSSPPTPALVLASCHALSRSIDQGGDLFVRKPSAGEGVQDLMARVVKHNAAIDIALLAVPGLRDTPVLALTAPGNVIQCVIAIGYANPMDLFNLTNENKKRPRAKLPGLSPGSTKWKSPQNNVGDITHTRLGFSSVGMSGMSGAPVVNEAGVIGILIQAGSDGDGKSISIAVSSDTVFQVLRRWAELPVNGPSTLEEVLNKLRIQAAVAVAQG